MSVVEARALAPIEAHLYPDLSLGHGLMLATGTAAANWTIRCLKWMNQVLARGASRDTTHHLTDHAWEHVHKVSVHSNF